MPRLAEGSDARLAWYFDLAHGSGLAYRVVTVTAVEDGAAYARLAERVARGDLQAWARDLDGLQHQSYGRVLTPVPWSPPTPALADIPTDGDLHEPTMYMEDTMWPFPGRLRRYVEAAGAVYRPSLGADRTPGCTWTWPWALETLPGAGRSPEVTLLQRLSEPPAADRAPDRGHPARGHRSRVLDARGTRTPGPVAVPAAAHRALVPAPMSAEVDTIVRPVRPVVPGR